jgi:hypothetical protein
MICFESKKGFFAFDKNTLLVIAHQLFGIHSIHVRNSGLELGI